MSAADGREVHLDLRLVPAALTSWAVTAAGILWSISGVVVLLSAAVAAASATAWWGGRHRAPQGGARMTAAAVVAIALVGLGFAVAVQLRVEQVRNHPLVDRVGDVTAVIVTPSETPRSLGGGRLMFRGSLQAVDADEMSGRVVVFASVVGFAELTAGQPAAFKARISRPTRRDLTVAVLSATGEPTLGRGRADPAGGAAGTQCVRLVGTGRLARRPSGDASGPRPR